jgi:alkanesulfonate monooxygenase SsuD/methylene tetrahydromethanopterin reductase-like flavin-dependent oxidoreductase (luciferase family)
LKLGLFDYGTVRMSDAGMAGPPAQDRRYGAGDFAAYYADLIGYAKAAEPLGYDSLWLTEHHFQHEGFEVVPNILMVSAVLAQHTERLRFGALCHVIPQWHPLRFAEDFAIADLMSGGRMIMGVGRGTVAREIVNFGSIISAATGGRMPADEADWQNRRQFEEGMAVIRAALGQERFTFQGQFHSYPPPGTVDRGRPVADLTLVPKLTRPLCEVEIWQPVGSEETFKYAAANAHKGVMYLGKRSGMKKRWRWFGELCAEHGRDVGVGGDRMLVVNVHVADSDAEAMAGMRDGHDEFYKLLAPYGATTHYTGPDGTRWSFGRMPTLEDSVQQGAFVVGSVERVRDELGEVVEELQPEVLTVMVRFPGMSPAAAREQMERFAVEVADKLPAPV